MSPSLSRGDEPEGTDELDQPSARQLRARLTQAIAESPADETEVLAIELRRGRTAVSVADATNYSRRELTIHVRVLERGRAGAFRTNGSSDGEIAHAIRQALGHAGVAPARRRVPPLPGSDEPAPKRHSGCDPRLMRMTPDLGRDWLGEHTSSGDAAILEWCDGHVMVANSRGLRRRERVTAVGLQVRSGEGAGAGFATNASRTLGRLNAPVVFERARRRRTTASPGELRSGQVPLLLSQEAAAELVDLLNHQAFSAHAYREGGSFLREHLGVQVFDQRVNLRDDGTDPAGLPFPFDLEGRTKRPLDLVRDGIPKTPTVDTRSAAEFGLEPTGHGVGGEEAFGLHLFLETGEMSEAELLAAADGGVWISRLEGVECFDPVRMRMRARARGVRMIEGGALTHPLPDLAWEDSVLRVFSDLRGLGRSTACRVSSDGVLGGISAPAVVIGEALDLRLAAGR